MSSVTRVAVFEDSGCSFMARVVGPDGANIVQADISSIACTVYDVTSGATVITPSVVVASSVFDALQTDARWSTDSTGYNFRHEMPATAFPVQLRTYRVEYKFTPTSGEVFFVVFEVEAVPIYAS